MTRWVRRRRRWWRTAGARPVRCAFAGAAAAAVLVAGLALVPGPPAAAAPGDPFDPGEGQVFVAQGIPTGLYRSVQGPGGAVFAPEGAASPFRYNALGYRTADQYLYAMRSDAGFRQQLLRIGEGGAVTTVGAVAGLPVLPGAEFWNQGGFGDGAAADTLYLLPTSGASELQAVDIATLTATPVALDAAVPNLADVVVLDGNVWGFVDAATAYRIDPVSGAVDVFATGLPASGPLGAQWRYGNGNLGLSANASGDVYQVEVTAAASPAPTFRLVSTIAGPASGNNDGAAIDGEPVDLAIAKTAASPTHLAGGPVSFTITVTNTSATPSSGFSVADPVPAGLTAVAAASPGAACAVSGGVASCTGGVLAPGATVAITVTGTAAAAPACIANTASVLGNEADPSAGNDTASATSCAARPAIAIDKRAGQPVDANGSGLTDAGDLIAYTFTVTNTGNTALDATAVDDPLVGTVTCAAAVLLPGAATSCAADSRYEITAADQAVGRVDNTATATGIDGGGVLVRSAPDSTSTPVARPRSGLAITKEVLGTPEALGDGSWRIRYRIAVTNTGTTRAVYDLDDQLRFGTGIAVIAAQVRPIGGGPQPNPAWDGTTDTLVAAATPISPGVQQVYLVVVEASVAQAAAASDLDCTLGTGESGTGLLNEASASIGTGAAAVSARACAPVSTLTVDKRLTGLLRSSGTDVEATYAITVDNRGAARAAYDLIDTLAWSEGITVTSARVAGPPGTAAGAGWDGAATISVARHVALEAGGRHVWTVTVRGTTSGVVSAASGDCTLAAGETGTGLMNTARVSANGLTERSDACQELPIGGAGPGTATGSLPATGTPAGVLAGQGLALVVLGAAARVLRRSGALRR